jgi:hypothetical protein
MRLAGAALALGGAFTLSGCQSRPNTTATAEPVPAAQPVPEVTTLFIRNFSGLDINVYAVPNDGAKPVWLTSVPVRSSRTVPLHAAELRANGGLVVRTQVVGGSKTWTSEPIAVDSTVVGVLDLNVDASRTTAGSILRGVTVQAFEAAMR